MSSRKVNSASLKEQNAHSLLHSSIIKANRSTVLEALKLGSNVKEYSKHGDPPIVAAAGVDPYTSHDSKSGKDKMMDILEIITDRSECDKNARGVGGETGLHRAVFVRSPSRIKYLLERGCDPDIRDSKGQTCLFGAMGFEEGLDYILRYRPMLDVFDFEGLTPLMHGMMSESPQTLKTVEMLIASGCNINACCAETKKTALMVTLHEDGTIPRSDQRIEKSLLLITHGIDLNAQDKEGKSILHHAAISQCTMLIKILLKNKASVDVKDGKGMKPLDVAKKTGNSEIVRMLDRAEDKSSRLLPYEESLANLEQLYSAVNVDEDLPVEQRHYIKSQIDKLQRSIQTLVNDGRGIQSMAVEHKRILKEQYQFLSEEMMPHLVIPYLVIDKVLTKEDGEEMMKDKARKPMCIKLLDLLPHRGEAAFQAFCSALRKTKQDHVCDVLLREETANS